MNRILCFVLLVSLVISASAAKPKVDLFEPNYLAQLLPENIIFLGPKPLTDETVDAALEKFRSIKEVSFHRAPEGMAMPKAVKQTQPRPPKASAEAAIFLLVSGKGEVVGLYVAKHDDRTWANSALAAAARWRFEPAALEGKPVPVLMYIPFVYKDGT